MHWFDAGVNLTDPRFELDDVLARASQSDVRAMTIIGTDVDESKHASKLIVQAKATYPDIHLCFTAGVHPHYAKDVGDDFVPALRTLLSHPACKAVGECGLDFNRNFSDPGDQLVVFEQQLMLACELQKPVYLHERDAFNQQITLLKKYADKLVGGVAHCFTGNLAQMNTYLELGFYIGITGWACDIKRGESLRAALPHLPLDRIVLETDAPYLKPKHVKIAGRNNEPAYLPLIADEVAKLMRVSPLELQQYATTNANRLFSIQERSQ